MSKMRPRTEDTTAGFTLVEALVAFAIATVLLGAIYDVYSTSIGAATGALRYGDAILLAQSALESLTNVPLSPGETSDRSGIFERETTIRSRADLVPEGSQLVLVSYDIVVRIAWRDGLRQRAVSLSTLRLSPR
jgi:general secretion pathway protein I